jgi:hypothetical protein
MDLLNNGIYTHINVKKNCSISYIDAQVMPHMNTIKQQKSIDKFRDSCLVNLRIISDRVGRLVAETQQFKLVSAVESW